MGIFICWVKVIFFIKICEGNDFSIFFFFEVGRMEEFCLRFKRILRVGKVRVRIENESRR